MIGNDAATLFEVPVEITRAVFLRVAILCATVAFLDGFATTSLLSPHLSSGSISTFFHGSLAWCSPRLCSLLHLERSVSVGCRTGSDASACSWLRP